jgi:hypothetical protein
VLVTEQGQRLLQATRIYTKANGCKYNPYGVEIFSVNLLCPCAVASCSTFAHEKVKTEWNNQGGKLSKRQSDT